MDYRARRLRTTLLLGTAFLAGLAIGPVSGLSRGISRPVLPSMRRSPRTPIEPIPTGCSRFLATYSSGCVVNTSIQSPTRT